MVEPVLEQRPVRQPGQRVVERLVGQLCRAALRSVMSCALADDIQRPSLAIADDRDAQQRPDSVTGRVAVALLDLEVVDLAGDQSLAIGLVLDQVVEVGDLLVCQVEHLRLAVAEHLAERLIDTDVAALRCRERHPDRRPGESAAKQLLALAQRLLGPLAVGDVLDLGRK